MKTTKKELWQITREEHVATEPLCDKPPFGAASRYITELEWTNSVLQALVDGKRPATRIVYDANRWLEAMKLPQDYPPEILAYYPHLPAYQGVKR